MEHRRLIIDADLLVYRFSHSSQQYVEWDDGMVTAHADGSRAREDLDRFVQKLLEDTESDVCTLALSDTEGSFRKELCHEYKAARGVIHRPMLFQFLRKLMLDEWGAVLYPRLEGDDVCGILATRESNEEKVIASIDKDLLNVSGLHYDWRDEGTVFYVSPADALARFMTQVLTGDSTDGFRGIPGVGPKRAERILEKAAGMTIEQTWRDVIVPAYVKAGLTEDHALMYARCAWVLHDHDYEVDTGEVHLWTPNREES